jgi:predicted acylesterase/phospholipase RssA/CRP-like cAMP-binding protein
MGASDTTALVGQLRASPLFADLPADAFEELARRARCQLVRPGDVVCRAGEPGDAFYLITAGLVEVRAPAAHGEHRVAQLGPLQWFGEMALITGEPRSATVVAVADTTLIRLERSAFQHLLRASPRAAMSISDALSRRLRAHLLSEPRRTPPRCIVAVLPPTHEAVALLSVVVRALEHVGGFRVPIVESPGSQVRQLLEAHPPLGVVTAEDAVSDLARRCSNHSLVVVPQLQVGAASAAVASADWLWLLGDGPDPEQPVSATTPVTRIRIGDAARMSPSAERLTLDRTVLERAGRPSAASASVLRRYARFVLRRRLGVAFSAGGARGLAHLGVLRRLEREGIEFDLAAGTSIGGVVAGGVALGLTSADLLAVFRRIAANVRRALVDPRLPSESLLRGLKKRQLIREHAGDAQIEDLPIPLWTIAADLASGREVALHHGPLWQAVDATSAIPGLFPPVRVGGRLLVDGWLVNSLPADVLRREGADVVLTVVVSSGGRLEAPSEMAIAGNGWAGWSTWARNLRSPPIGRIVMTAIDVGARERTLANLALADACVSPELDDCSVTDLGRLEDIVDRGEAAAETALGSIHAAIRRRSP